jgi:hypothetical protein
MKYDNNHFIIVSRAYSLHTARGSRGATPGSIPHLLMVQVVGAVLAEFFDLLSGIGVQWHGCLPICP